MKTANIAAIPAVVTQGSRADSAPESSVSAQESTGENAGQTAQTTIMDPTPAPAAQNGTPRHAAMLPMAPFVAQLIATHQSLPQTRARNRAAPAAAAFAYRDTGRRAGN